MGVQIHMLKPSSNVGQILKPSFWITLDVRTLFIHLSMYLYKFSHDKLRVPMYSKISVGANLGKD